MTSTSTPLFVRAWLSTLESATIAEVAPDPATTALFSADVINGFFRFGALASPRLDELTQPIVDLFTRCHRHGVRRFVLMQDTHDPATPEFASYPPHCLAGSPESQMIPEFAALPFADMLTVIPKNSLNPAIETGFDAWWDANRDLSTAIVVGDCTDLCVYQLAMHLRMRANALNLQDFTVIVPTHTVDTFDVPESRDSPPNAPHPGDFFHDVFLYHMAQNGIRVIRDIAG